MALDKSDRLNPNSISEWSPFQVNNRTLSLSLNPSYSSTFLISRFNAYAPPPVSVAQTEQSYLQSYSFRNSVHQYMSSRSVVPVVHNNHHYLAVNKPADFRLGCMEAVVVGWKHMCILRIVDLCLDYDVGYCERCRLVEQPMLFRRMVKDHGNDGDGRRGRRREGGQRRRRLIERRGRPNVASGTKGSSNNTLRSRRCSSPSWL